MTNPAIKSHQLHKRILNRNVFFVLESAANCGEED